LHSMAYYIFLKSLRSLVEFRKKFSCQNSSKISSYKFPKPWYNQKSNFYSKKNFSSLSAQNSPAASRPVRPLSPATLPGTPLLPQAAHARSAHPSLRGLGVIARSRLFLEFAQPGGYAFSLCHRHVGPTCQLRRLPRTADPG
jgi:hypothetical protein